MRPAEPNWFIALTVDPGSWYGPFLRSIPRHIRAFGPLDLHITVAFLGPSGERPARAAWESVTPHFVAPLSLILTGIEAMGNRWRPSAFALTSAEGPDGEVGQFIGDARDAAWARAGARSDARPPTPHVTVVRPPRRCSLEEMQEILTWARSVGELHLPLVLDRLALYTRSVERGRQFRTIDERVLGDPPTAAAG